MQPAQLSLLADQVPPPAPTVLANLPDEEVAEAISLLAALIAKASSNAAAGAGRTEEAQAGE